MIEIAPQTASMLYVGLLLCILFAIWSYDSWKGNKKRLSIAENEAKISCEFCGHSFRNSSIIPIVQCPLCQCLLKKPGKPPEKKK